MKSICFFSILLFLGIYTPLQAQEAEEPHKNMFAIGLNFNTQDGVIGGVNMRYSHFIDEKNYHLFFLEFVDIKHAREQRTTSNYTGEFFVPGKENYLFAIRPQYGRERVLFKKGINRGVQVDAMVSAGPTLGLVAPYMIRYIDPNTFKEVETQFTKEKNIPFGNITGTGTWSESIGKAKPVLGVSSKLSLVLEFGIFNSLWGIEAGGMLDIFTKKIIIMPYSENKAIYPSLFFTIYTGFGK